MTYETTNYFRGGAANAATPRQCTNAAAAKVLENALFGCEITAQSEKNETDDNPKLIDSFVSAKRIEGCSEKTLKYYRTTIETMVASIDKGIRHIQTEDLRSYLTDYQSKNQSSRVTIDNIRRILSSFSLGWRTRIIF